MPPWSPSPSLSPSSRSSEAGAIGSHRLRQHQDKAPSATSNMSEGHYRPTMTTTARGSGVSSTNSAPWTGISTRVNGGYPHTYDQQQQQQQQLGRESSRLQASTSRLKGEEEDGHSQDELAAAASGHVGGGGAGQRRKRAKHGVKIKRNRKITSCLACRERKQKVSHHNDDPSHYSTLPVSHTNLTYT